MRVLQVVRDVNEKGTNAKHRPINSGNRATGWRIDCPGCPAERPFADVHGAARVSGNSFTLEDNPAHLRKNHNGKLFYTCITARCSVGNSKGRRKVLGCVTWGWRPNVRNGKLAAGKHAAIPTPKQLKIVCGLPPNVAAAVKAWTSHHKKPIQ